MVMATARPTWRNRNILSARVPMDRTAAVEELCANVKRWWKIYGNTEIIPTLLLHDGNRWRWCPLFIEWESGPDAEYQYTEAVRQMTKLHGAIGAASAGTRRQELGG